MTEICLPSIDFPEFQWDGVNICKALIPENDRDGWWDAKCQSNTFLSYAESNWAEHYRYTTNSKYTGTIARFLETCYESCWTYVDDPPGKFDRADIFNTLDAASYGGHDKVVQLLLDKKAKINACGRFYKEYALWVASCEGHIKVVQLLLNNGAEVNAEVHVSGGFLDSALRAASERGHDKVVQLLLDRGAEIDLQCETHGNALQQASLEGHIKVVQLLLDNGAEVNAPGGRQRTGGGKAMEQREGHIFAARQGSEVNLSTPSTYDSDW
ncbi:MAG: hypothetical protein L6R40_008706 [Gallowayella cf. fulva]|nr:MAG: hypothetical protein L6R40_008706 [Xanthomendoza cf. fulva]